MELWSFYDLLRRTDLLTIVRSSMEMLKGRSKECIEPDGQLPGIIVLYKKPALKIMLYTRRRDEVREQEGIPGTEQN